MKKGLFAILLVFVLIFTSACSNGASSQAPSTGGSTAAGTSTPEESTGSVANTADGDLPVFAFLPSNAGNASQVAYAKFLTELQEPEGFKLVVLDSLADVQKQTDNVGSAVAQGVDLIMITPVDSKAIIPACQAAMEAGVPVVVTVSQFGEEYLDVAYKTFVGLDNIFAGEMVADAFKEHFGDEAAKVVMLEGTSGTEAALRRGEGFVQGIEGTGIELIDRKNINNWAPDEAFTVMEDFLVRYSEIDGVYAQWDDGMVAIVQAMKDAGRHGDVFLVSIDGRETGFDMVRNGDVDVVVAQDIKDISTKMVQAGKQILAGEEVEPLIWSPTVLITKDNVDDYEPW